MPKSAFQSKCLPRKVILIFGTFSQPETGKTQNGPRNDLSEQIHLEGRLHQAGAEGLEGLRDVLAFRGSLNQPENGRAGAQSEGCARNGRPTSNRFGAAYTLQVGIRHP